MKFVLASGSPQRRKLLKGLGRPFEIVPSDVSERSREKNPRRLVALLAKRKALAVAKLRPDAVVLGADTLVACKGEILGKPKNEKDALRMLKKLSGSWQRVYTGVTVARAGGKKSVSGVAVTRCKARRLPEAELARLAKKHLDKAGAYAVQDQDDPFIETLDGDYDNVVGLPMKLVRKLLSVQIKSGWTEGRTK